MAILSYPCIEVIELIKRHSSGGKTLKKPIIAPWYKALFFYFSQLITVLKSGAALDVVLTVFISSNSSFSLILYI